MEAAERFLNESYIATFNEKFAVAPAEKGTAFRRTTRADLDWIFTVQNERIVAKDNTVASAERNWQLEKSRFRSSLAGCTVTIHQHLDETVSIRYGPRVAGRYEADAAPRLAKSKRTAHGGGKDGPTASTTSMNATKTRKPRSASSRGTSGLVN